MPGRRTIRRPRRRIIGLTKTLCKEWGRYKVNVNCVAFGLIQTRLTQPLDGRRSDHRRRRPRDQGRRAARQMLDAMARMIPLGRGGTPEEAAGAVYLFCIPESNYISGQVHRLRRRPADLRRS